MRPDDQEQQNEVCERLRSELKAYVDGQAGWWQRQSVGRHLTKCADCREETAAMREFSAKWQRADDEVLDPNLRARILAAVPDSPPVLTRVTATSRPRHRALALAGAGASAVIGAALLFPLWQRSTRVESEDAAKMSLHSTSSVTSASSPAMSSGATQTADGAAATAAAPSALERSVAASSALPSKAKQTQIADARPSAFDKAGGETVAAKTSGAEGNGSVPQDAAGERAASPAPSSAAMSAKSAALPMTATPSISGSADATPAPGASAAADSMTRDDSHLDNRTYKPSVTSKFDKSKSDSYAAKSKPSTDANGRDKNAAQQEAQESPQTGTATIVRKAVHAMPPGGNATPAAPRLFAPQPAPMRSPASSAHGRAMTHDSASAVLLKISVAHIETATASIERYIRAAGGSVVSSATQTDASGAKSATLLLKAPAASLNALLAQAEQTGTTLLKSIPPLLPDAPAADAAKRRTNAPASKESRGQKAYTNVTIQLLNRKEAP